LLLAYLRGWITPEFRKQGLRSHLRQELILSALAAELDAQAIRVQVQTQASTLSALKWAPQELGQTVDQMSKEMMRAYRLNEFDFSEQAQAAQTSGTVDYLFQLYQALLDAKVIPKVHE
jgi:hypothetical protein